MSAHGRLRRLLARPQTPYQLTALALLAAALYLGKLHYSSASADGLRWILAPTASLVSWGSGGDFVYERGTGWVSREQWFIIAPACAGVNFALAAFAALVVGGLGAVRSWRTALLRVVGAAALAYVATLLVNTVRILIAIRLHHGRTEFAGLGPADLHQVEGILVYLGGLCALYALARPRAARKVHELAC